MSASDPYRVSLSAEVRERLLRHPQSYQVPAANLDMFAVRDFLTPEECAGLIRLIDKDRQPSAILGDVPDPAYRSSESCNLDPSDPLVRAVDARFTGTLGIAPENGEAIQGQRYAAGQQFKEHHDFFFVDQPYWKEQEAAGGQRTWTAMVFLNRPEAGGQTYFPMAGVKITPRTGNLLAWNNLDPAGEPNLASLHEGLPVEAGVKYVVTKWYRERR